MTGNVSLNRDALTGKKSWRRANFRQMTPLELYRRRWKNWLRLRMRGAIGKGQKLRGRGREIVTYIVDRNIELHTTFAMFLWQVLRILSERTATKIITC